LHRLFSTFARGWPGVGLLLLRLIAAIALISQAWPQFHSDAPDRSIPLPVLSLAAALLLLGGLWTPVAGILVLAIETWTALSKPGDHWIQILLGALGAGLALLGPGVFSIDARLFGWKRIGPRKGNR
jgi:putative oxidoreductase